MSDGLASDLGANLLGRDESDNEGDQAELGSTDAAAPSGLRNQMTAVDSEQAFIIYEDERRYYDTFYSR